MGEAFEGPDCGDSGISWSVGTVGTVGTAGIAVEPIPQLMLHGMSRCLNLTCPTQYALLNVAVCTNTNSVLRQMMSSQCVHDGS